MIRILSKKCLFLPTLFCIAYTFPAFSQCLSVRKSAKVVVARNNGDINFNNPENIKEADELTASVAPAVSVSLGSPINSQELEVKDFGFAIPLLSVICGVEVRLKRKASSFVSVTLGPELGAKDKQVMLLKSGNTTGINTAKSSVWKPTDDADYIQYGGSAGLWGTTLVPEDVNATDFGVSIAVSFSSLVSAFPTAEIDHVEMVVYYQPIYVLPITISRFQAYPESDQVNLSWEIHHQQDGAFALLERSADSKNWAPIYKQLLTSEAIPKAFSTIDQPEEPGKYYYRLKVVSPDGTTAYSKEVIIMMGTASIQHPLFVQQGNKLIINYSLETNTIYLLNSSGQRCIIPSNKHTSVIDIGHLPTGIYFLTINGHTQKFLKHKTP